MLVFGGLRGPPVLAPTLFDGPLMGVPGERRVHPVGSGDRPGDEHEYPEPLGFVVQVSHELAGVDGPDGSVVLDKGLGEPGPVHPDHHEPLPGGCCRPNLIEDDPESGNVLVLAGLGDLDGAVGVEITVPEVPYPFEPYGGVLCSLEVPTGYEDLPTLFEQRTGGS